jgi:hypothetical protein
LDQASRDSQEQVLAMNNERFTIPELLFSPSNIGKHSSQFSSVIDAQD